MFDVLYESLSTNDIKSPKYLKIDYLHSFWEILIYLIYSSFTVF